MVYFRVIAQQFSLPHTLCVSFTEGLDLFSMSFAFNIKADVDQLLIQIEPVTPLNSICHCDDQSCPVLLTLPMEFMSEVGGELVDYTECVKHAQNWHDGVGVDQEEDQVIVSYDLTWRLLAEAERITLRSGHHIESGSSSTSSSGASRRLVTSHRSTRCSITFCTGWS